MRHRPPQSRRHRHARQLLEAPIRSPARPRSCSTPRSLRRLPSTSRPRHHPRRPSRRRQRRRHLNREAVMCARPSRSASPTRGQGGRQRTRRLSVARPRHRDLRVPAPIRPYVGDRLHVLRALRHWAGGSRLPRRVYTHPVAPLERHHECQPVRNGCPRGRAGEIDQGILLHVGRGIRTPRHADGRSALRDGSPRGGQPVVPTRRRIETKRILGILVP